MSPLLPDSAERRAIDAVRRHALEGRLPEATRCLGLGSGECAALMSSVGLGEAADALAMGEVAGPPFLSPLIALLWAHRAGADAWTRLMAGTVVSACFGARHLWQDLGLQGRGEVSALLSRHFPQLAAGNTRELKWKRYLFLRLGAELELPDLRPPRCEGCDEFNLCFAPPGAGISVAAIRSTHGGQTHQQEATDDRAAGLGLDDRRR